MDITQLLSSLNDEQRPVVTQPLNSPIALIAGAGSGKTKTLTAKVAYLIHQEKLVPRRLCCLTFTNKAAGEIRERVGMEDDHHGPRIGTIHSLALSAIRRSPKGFGLGEKVTPLDDYDQTEMIKRLVNAAGLEETINPYLLLEKISFHRARGVGFAEEFTADMAARAETEHAGYHRLSSDELDIWKKFQVEKTKNSVVDFDDMIHLFIRRGRSDEKWRTGLQKSFDFVLMDEAQDTNVPQWEMVNLLLAPDNRNLMCVGDVSQSIYAFSGAAPELLLGFAREWRGVVPTQYKLQQNYRSVPEIVSLANRVQSHMTDTIPLKMESNRGLRGHSGKITLRKGPLPRDIASFVSEEIATRTDGTLYRDIAILVRAGSQVRDIETELVRNRIPYIIRGTMGLLQTEEVKDILSYLKIASNPHDFSALCRSVSVPKRGMGEVALKKLHEASQQFDGDIITTIQNRSVQKLGSYIQIVRELQQRSHNPSEAIDYLIRAIKYEEYLTARYKKFPDKIEIKLNNLQRLKEMIVSLMAERDMTIEDVVFQLTMQDQKDVGTDGKVIVSTIHASKGLEWKTVYLMGLYEGSLPHKWSQSDSEIEEERRLFYVGCTRAKDMLVLGVPAMIDPYNRGPQFVAPSRFLTELGIIK